MLTGSGCSEARVKLYSSKRTAVFLLRVLRNVLSEWNTEQRSRTLRKKPLKARTTLANWTAATGSS